MAQLMQNFITIVTGGTGSLGREVVAEFVRNGALVVTNYRDEKKFRDLKNYTENPDLVTGYRADLTSEAQVKAFFQNFSASHQRLDVFLHIMGGFWMGKDIVETPLEKWNHMIDLNLTGAFLCSREAFTIMKAQCSGKIFTVSAKTALDLPAGMGAYSVSKAGVLALTEIMAKEGKPYDIQTNAILPSLIDTAANRKAMPDADFSQWVSPGDIAGMLVQLCQPQENLISGTAIKVYGKL